MKVSEFAVKNFPEKQTLLENHVCKKTQRAPLWRTPAELLYSGFWKVVNAYEGIGK